MREVIGNVVLFVLSLLTAVALIQHGCFFYSFPPKMELVNVALSAYVALTLGIFVWLRLFIFIVRTEKEIPI